MNKWQQMGKTYTPVDTETGHANYGTTITPSVKNYTGFKARLYEGREFY